jgi:hypothetical protein
MKIGDRVKLISTRFIHCDENPIWSNCGVIGTIIKRSVRDMGISVVWDNGIRNAYHESDLEIMDKPIIDVDELFKEIEI